MSSNEKDGAARATYCIRSDLIFHSNRRAFVSAGIHDCALMERKKGAELTRCLFGFSDVSGAVIGHKLTARGRPLALCESNQKLTSKRSQT